MSQAWNTWALVFSHLPFCLIVSDSFIVSPYNFVNMHCDTDHDIVHQELDTNAYLFPEMDWPDGIHGCVHQPGLHLCHGPGDLAGSPRDQDDGQQGEVRSGCV